MAAAAPPITALMGGHVQAVWADYPTVVSQLKGGTLRALVTTSPKRLAVLPGVPIMEETGITKYEAEIFYGLVAPAKTPPDGDQAPLRHAARRDEHAGDEDEVRQQGGCSRTAPAARSSAPS